MKKHLFDFKRPALICAVVLLLCGASPLAAQTTVIGYQGRINENNAPATGSFDLEFRLFATATGGTPLTAVSQANVAVVNGVFSVQLAFPPNAFTGAPRHLEIAVKPAGSTAAPTVIAPRQLFTSTPYAIRSLSAGSADTATSALNADNAGQLGGTPASQFVQISDARLTDARQPLAGSGNYIQNQTAAVQTGGFNINGNATVGGILSGNFVDSFNGYNFRGLRILSASSNSIIAGINAGPSSSGGSNAFFGTNAGAANTTGQLNTFIGSSAGAANTISGRSTFVGSSAGQASTGAGNSFFGASAGGSNTTGNGNTYVGTSSALFSTTGSNNAFFGFQAGVSNADGSNNTMLGVNTDVASGALTFATAVGSGAVAPTSNTIALGRANGADTVRIFGLGAAGTTQLCRNANNEISSCSSSLRYKTNVASFGAGLSFIRQLRPISYEWKEGGLKDVGFGAEEVARIDPLFVNFNAAGEVEGVKYDRFSVAFVNAFIEQQTQIESLQEQVKRQETLIENLARLVCAQNPQADVCREKK